MQEQHVAESQKYSVERLAQLRRKALKNFYDTPFGRLLLSKGTESKHS